jgi:ribosomal-protein-alanine N-acetyltransferase
MWINLCFRKLRVVFQLVSISIGLLLLGGPSAARASRGSMAALRYAGITDLSMFLFESERLLFREHQPGDMEAYCALEADPEVRRYVGGAPRPHELAARKFRTTFLKNAARKLALRATIFKPEGRYIGYSGLYPNFRPGGSVPGEAVLGFCLAREYWGRGLASEAGRAFVNFGFDQLRLKRIVAVAEVGNAASIRVLEKLGFVCTKTELGPRSFYRFELQPSPVSPGALRDLVGGA